MTKSEIYAANDVLADDIAGKQSRLTSLQAEVDSLSNGLAEMPTTYADLQAAAEALAADHPQRVKWDELKAEFLAIQTTVNGGITPTPTP